MDRPLLIILGPVVETRLSVPRQSPSRLHLTTRAMLLLLRIPSCSQTRPCAIAQNPPSTPWICALRVSIDEPY